MRILGLDYGDKTVGVALSDPTFLIASGVETIFRDSEVSIKKTVARLGEIIKENEVNLIILGYPKNMDNTEGPRCEKTVLFKERLERNFKKIPVVLWDERLSTVTAINFLIEGDVRRENRKQVVDKMAAVIILQNYLDSLDRK